MKKINCEYTDDVICPYCGHVQMDSWELIPDHEECSETDCGECGEAFEYCVHKSITFTSFKKDPHANE